MNLHRLMTACGDLQRYVPLEALSALGGPPLSSEAWRGVVENSALLRQAVEWFPVPRLDTLRLLIAALAMEASR